MITYCITTQSNDGLRQCNTDICRKFYQSTQKYFLRVKQVAAFLLNTAPIDRRLHGENIYNFKHELIQLQK